MREILFVSQKYCEFLWLFDETKRYAADLVLATPRLSDACYSDKQASIWSSYLRTAILVQEMVPRDGQPDKRGGWI